MDKRKFIIKLNNQTKTTTMKNLFVKVKSALVTKEDKTITQSKKVFVNGDGTIAESHDTYKQFKSDLSQRSYGW